MKKRLGLTLFVLLFLALFSAPALGAVTEVTQRESAMTSLRRIMIQIPGGNWDDLENLLVEAVQAGETEMNMKLTSDTFMEFLDTDLFWYHAARAGIMDADCSYSDGGWISVKNFKKWPCPMYLVHTREDFSQAISLRRDRSGEDFGVLPDEELFRAFLSDAGAMNRLEYDAGMYRYENCVYNEGQCVFRYLKPDLGEVFVRDVNGLEACIGAVREAAGGTARAVVLVMDGDTLRRLTASPALQDDFLCTAGFGSGGYWQDEAAGALVFPVTEETFMPGFRIAETVRQGREKSLNMMQKLILARARDLTRFLTGTAEEKAAKLHDLLCREILYTVDDSTDLDDCCTGALLYGQANCDGYADAFYLCASLLGIPVRFISGDEAEAETAGPESVSTHMWNLIELDGTWRSVDVTWDDREEDGVSREYFNLGLSGMEREYFFRRELLPSPFAEEEQPEPSPVPRRFTFTSR